MSATLLATTLGIVIKATVVVAAAAVAQALMGRRASAAARHLVWTLAIAGLLVLPVASVLIPGWTVVRLPADGPTEVGRHDPGSTEAGRHDPGPTEVERHDATVRTTDGVAVAARAPGRVSVGSLVASGFSRTFLFIVYALGVLVLAIRLAADAVAIRRLARRASDVTDPESMALFRECADRMRARRPVRFLRSRERAMPMAFGIRRPAILIPSVGDTWDGDRRRAVLLHELAHVARRDCATELLAGLACALYWFHPGVWAAARRLRIERERACDDRVLAAGAPAHDYAGHLLELAYAFGDRHTHALAVGMARPRQLEGRLLAVLDAARNRALPTPRRRLAAVAIAAAVLLAIAGARATTERPASQAQAPAPVEGRAPGGTWEVRPSRTPGSVQVHIREGESTSSSLTVSIARLEELTGVRLSTEGPITFSIKREQGTFTIDGRLHGGVGVGTFSFTPDPAFADGLAQRGLARPSAAEQYALARSNIGIAFVDELAAQRYERPVLAQLVRAAQHGVGLAFLREMGMLGYRLGLIDALVVQRQHGIDPEYIRGMASQGLTGLSPDDLIRARSHGIDPEYVKGMTEAGHAKLSLDELIELRSHGIDPEYIGGLAAFGFRGLPLAELVRLRSHGVEPDYIKGLAAHGHRNLSLDDLVRLRSQGIEPEYIAGLAALGYRNLPLDRLVALRQHGIEPEYVREMQSLGYKDLGLDDLVALRQHGVEPDRVRAANARAGSRLSVEALTALAGRGWK